MGWGWAQTMRASTFARRQRHQMGVSAAGGHERRRACANEVGARALAFAQ